MDNSEKLTTNGGYTRRRKTTQYVLYTTMRKQTQMRHEPSYKQDEVKLSS